MASIYDGKYCKLNQNIRDAAGTVRNREEAVLILKEQTTLGKVMYLCQFLDGHSTYLFRDEFELID